MVKRATDFFLALFCRQTFARYERPIEMRRVATVQYQYVVGESRVSFVEKSEAMLESLTLHAPSCVEWGA